jgi:polar amino acid transport system permease protein
MSYTLQWGQVTPYIPYLLGGAVVTLHLAFLGFVGGFVIGLINASAIRMAPRVFGRLARAYVVFFLNTPLLVQIFFIFFGLPDFGLVLDPYSAVLLGLALNEGAYLTQTLLGGFNAVRREELDAAETLGLRPWQTLFYVILPQVCRSVYPALSNQYILITMTTSIAAIFGIEELTGRAYNIDAQVFRSFEIFSLAAVDYVGLTLIASVLLALAGRWLFGLRIRLVP